MNEQVDLTSPDDTVRGEAGPTTAKKMAFLATVVLLLAPLVVVLGRETFFWAYAWLPAARLESLFADTFGGAFRPHLIHILALSASHTMVLVGLVVQFRRPVRRVAPIWQATAGLLLALLTWPFIFASTGLDAIPPPVYIIMVLAILAGFLHPARPVTRLPVPADRVMTVLWLVAAIPALFLVSSQLRLQLIGIAGDPHWEHAHYNLMAEYGLHLLLVPLLGASTLAGWRISAWTAAFMVGVVGVGFVALPNAAGSGGTFWGLAMIAWALVWLVATEFRQRRGLQPSAASTKGEHR